jgi:hypothetical protein
VFNSTDCDDDAAGVNPSASESCNNVDDDCDGNVDEGVTQPYFHDGDDDGFGDAGDVVDACSLPADHVVNSTDCNDNNDTVFPGALEICNGFDDDCDGTTDEFCGGSSPSDTADTGSPDTGDADTDTDTDSDTDSDTDTDSDVDTDTDTDTDVGGGTSCTDDLDGDGFISAACDGVDCDDGRPSVNPAAVDVCDNHRDDNCDGDIDETVCGDVHIDVHIDGGSLTFTLTGAVYAFLVDASGAPVLVADTDIAFVEFVQPGCFDVTDTCSQTVWDPNGDGDGAAEAYVLTNTKAESNLRVRVKTDSDGDGVNDVYYVNLAFVVITGPATVDSDTNGAPGNGLAIQLNY